MKKLIKIFLLISILNISSYAKYITSINGSGVDITRVFIHTNGAVSLYISGTVLNEDNCSSTFRVYIPETLPGKDSMLSAALMGYASKKKVGFHGSGCSTTHFWGGTVDVPIVNNLWIF